MAPILYFAVPAALPPPPNILYCICIRHVFKIALQIYGVAPYARCSIITCLIFASLFTVLASRFISIFIFVSPFPSLHWSPVSYSTSISSHLPPHLNLQYLPIFLTEHRVTLLSAPSSVFVRYWLEMDFYWIQDGPLNKVTKRAQRLIKNQQTVESLISFTIIHS